MNRYVVRKITFSNVIDVKSKVFNSREEAETYYNLSILPYSLSSSYFVNKNDDICYIDGEVRIEINLGEI